MFKHLKSQRTIYPKKEKNKIQSIVKNDKYANNQILLL